jgi:hypothetical protein
MPAARSAARSGRGRGLTIAAAALVTLVAAAGVTLVLTKHPSNETTATSDATVLVVNRRPASADAAPVATTSTDAPPPDAMPVEVAPLVDAGAQTFPPAPVPPVPPPHRPPPVAHAFGDLEILVEPWAAVVIDGRSLGQTPVREKLPVGKHRVRITNDVSGKDETVTVVVDPGRTTTIQRKWR